MKTLLSKVKKTSYEATALSIYNVKLEDIYIYETERAALKNKIPEALALVGKTGDFQNLELLGNLFNGNIKDCHDCDHQAYEKRKYTMRDYLQTINDMQLKVVKSEDVYTNNLLLGNAFYNKSFYGNARIFIESNERDCFSCGTKPTSISCSTARHSPILK